MGNANTISNTAEPTMNLTANDLKDLITAAISAARKPNEVEALELEQKKEELLRQRAQVEQDQKTRQETAEQQLAIIANRKLAQRTCTHKHRKGDSHCVYVSDDLGGYCLCQKCQAVIRPGTAPKGYTGSVIYDGDLFNRIFQETSSNEMFG